MSFGDIAVEQVARKRQIQKMLPNGDYIWVDVDENEIIRDAPVPAAHGHQIAGAFTCTRCGLGFQAQYALAEHVIRDHRIDNSERDMTIVQIPAGTDDDGNTVFIEKRAFEVPELQTKSKVATDVEALNWQKQFLAQKEAMEMLKTQNEELAETVQEMSTFIQEQAEKAKAEEAKEAIEPEAPTVPKLKIRGKKQS